MYPMIASADPVAAEVGASSSAEPQLAPRPRTKRHQVARACDACRTHRTKCDGQLPCTSCKKRDSPCSNANVNKVPTLSRAHQEIERLRQKIQSLEQELHQEREKTTYLDQLPTPASSSPSQFSNAGRSEADPGSLRKAHWEGIHIRAARSPHKTWYGPSSLFYFIRRCTNFMNSALQQNLSADHIVPDSGSKVLHEPITDGRDAMERLQETSTGDPMTTGSYLSPTQEEYFLNFFWESFHTSLFPILDEAEFKRHYRSLWSAFGDERKPSALVDIVIAMCMQYGISRLPAATQGSLFGDNDAAIAGRWHYRRSQTLLAFELETPTISTLQCHLLCVIYLCSGSFQNMADSACALAVRGAYMLGLHLEPPQSMPQRERESRKRLWWALYVLDSKIGMKLGRPFLLRDSNATPTLPGDDLEVSMLSGSNFAPLGTNVTWLSFHLQNSKLFAVARATHIAFYEDGLNLADGQTVWEDVQSLESYTDLLYPHMKNLEDWVDGVPAALKTKRQNNGCPFSTDFSALDIEPFAPLWLQRQRIILELMYHNLCMNIYRPFISFTSAQASIPTVEKIAMSCAAHAIALTHITHQVLSSTSILDGWNEAFQWQWNAAMTLVGFALAYQQSESVCKARSAMDLSVAVLDTFGKSFSVAASAANIMRDLGTKVDFLAQRNREKQALSAVNQTVNETMTVDSLGQLDDRLSFMDNSSTLPGATDDASIFTDSAIGLNQDVFDMALAIDLWGDFDNLWPSAGGTFPQFGALAPQSI